MTYSIINRSQLEGANRIDAEYYQPEYLELIHKIQTYSKGHIDIKKHGCKVVSGPFGSSLKSESYLEDGVPFIRINDLKDFFVDPNNLVYISNKDNDRLKQSQLFPGDLVLSKVGNTIGIVSVIPDDFKVCNISENNIGIKLKDKRYKNYLLVFLNSKLGQPQIIRKISGNAQPKLNIQDVYDLILPIPTEKVINDLEILTKQAENFSNESRNLYSLADNLLLEELGLSFFAKASDDEERFYIVNFSNIKSANRVDAEFFQPKYNKLISKIKTQNSKLLGELVSMKKGFEPGTEAYQEKGKLFIRVSSISKFGIDKVDQKYLSDDMYKKLQSNFEPHVGEILLTKDATPGIAYVLTEPVEGIISGGILRLKLKENIEPEYLALCINSLMGQMQAERDSGGSVIIHWKPEEIKNVVIPILAQPVQQKIADLVRKSHEARKKSKELLEEAKRKVEEMIEKNGKN